MITTTAVSELFLNITNAKREDGHFLPNDSPCVSGLDRFTGTRGMG